MTYRAETWILTKNMEKLAVAQRNMERSLLNITNRNKNWNEVTNYQNPICVTDDDVRCLVRVSPCKFYDLDPVSTSLVKDCIDILMSSIATVINLSLSDSSFLSHFKFALVNLLLKKPLLIRIT